jgi:hypothetical protein
MFPKAAPGTTSPTPTFNINAIEQWLYRVPGLPDTAPAIVHMNDDFLFVGPITPQDLFGPSCNGVRVIAEKPPSIRALDEGAYARQVAQERETRRGRSRILSIANSVLALGRSYDKETSVHPYLKPAPRVYMRHALYDITTELFREETVATATHKFCDAEDVVTPFLYSGVIRAVNATTRIHPKCHHYAHRSKLSSVMLCNCPDFQQLIFL